MQHFVTTNLVKHSSPTLCRSPCLSPPSPYPGNTDLSTIDGTQLDTYMLVTCDCEPCSWCTCQHSNTPFLPSTMSSCKPPSPGDVLTFLANIPPLSSCRSPLQPWHFCTAQRIRGWFKITCVPSEEIFRDVTSFQSALWLVLQFSNQSCRNQNRTG